ncbi:MAG: thioredoxin domain-containing protein, partial [Armatimonadetes bacterium]|nr:thioredoxin domain-containing protein [Armatimonadota bacterium]
RGNFEGGATVLHLVRSPQELAAGRGWTISQVEAALEDARQALLAARAERVPPFRDEKILTAWNGLAISALARAGLLLAEPRYLQAAAEAATLLVEKLGLGGHLYRVYKDGVVKVEGYLEDYGALIVGLLDLFGATGDPGWYRRAAAHAQTVIHEFADEENGDFYMTAAGGPRLLVRPKDRHDSATPSGTSLMAHALVRLYHLSGEERYRLLADNLFRCHAEAMRSNPWGMANLICALDSYLAEPETVVICGQPDETAPLVRAATERYRPNLLVCLRRPETPDGELPDLLHQKSRIGNQPAAWLCRHFACQAPITSPDELRAALGD